MLALPLPNDNKLPNPTLFGFTSWINHEIKIKSLYLLEMNSKGENSVNGSCSSQERSFCLGGLAYCA